MGTEACLGAAYPAGTVVKSTRHSGARALAPTRHPAAFFCVGIAGFVRYATPRNDESNSRRVSPEGLLHRQCRPVHLRVDVGRDLVGQDVDDPIQPAARIAIGEYL